MDTADLDLALGSGTDDTSGQANETPSGGSETPAAGEGAKPAIEPAKPNDTTQGDGTANPEAPASVAGKEEAKGVLPKELEPHKDLSESRKWDLTKPDGVAKLAQSYKEVESFAQKTKTLSKNSQDKAARVEALVSGSAEDLNKYRQSRGLPPLAVDTRTHQERDKAHADFVAMVNKALAGDTEAYNALDAHLAKEKENLIIAKIQSEHVKPKTEEQAFTERKAVAVANYQDLLRANPEVKTYVDELTDYLDAGGALDALGIDTVAAFQTQETTAAFVEIGQALNVFRNLDKVVEGRVTAELERRRTAVNAGGPGNKGGKGSTPKESDEKQFDPTTVFQ
jgi:hypothetical protein